MSIQYGQNIAQQTNGDSIAKLQVDQIPPNPSEMQIIDTLFKQNPKTTATLIQESRDVFIIAFLIIIFNLNQVDMYIQKFVPITSRSPYILLGFKGLLGGLLFWLIKHFYLARNK